MESAADKLDEVEEDLMARSFLFANPISYRDGVGAATQAIRAMFAKADRRIEAKRTREETS